MSEASALRDAICAIHSAATDYALHPGAAQETKLLDSIDAAYRLVLRGEDD